MHGMSSASSQGSPVLDNSSMKSKMADTFLNGIELPLRSEFDIVVGLARETSRARATGQRWLCVSLLIVLIFTSS